MHLVLTDAHIVFNFLADSIHSQQPNVGGDPLVDVIEYRVIHLRQHMVDLLLIGREHPCVGCQLTAYEVCPEVVFVDFLSRELHARVIA